ncbi:hypothetical protein ES703_113772 [subsurface metagenome]
MDPRAHNSTRPREISTSLQPKESLTNLISGLFIDLYGLRGLILICMAIQRELRRDFSREEKPLIPWINFRSSGDLRRPLQDPGDPQRRNLVKSARTNTPKRLKTRIKPLFVIYLSMDISGGISPLQRHRCRPIFHYGNDTPGQNYTGCRREEAKTVDPLPACLKASAASNLLHRLMHLVA